MGKPQQISVFEHERLTVGKSPGFTASHREALETFCGADGVPYFTLIHKGVKFNQYVGVLQVGNLTIEVLPKADRKVNSEGTDHWRKVLIGMLRAVHGFDVHAPSNASLKLQPNAVLDLYFELFLREAEQLLHKGLIKRYRKTEGNRTALKGSLLFPAHIRHNLVHKERFYVRHTVYDQQHPLNCVLRMTLQLLHRINTIPALQSRIAALLLAFPELPTVPVSQAFFERIQYNRKTTPYKRAIDIAALLLLNYHPDLSTGRQNVLALLFNMNNLWEQFVYVSLKKAETTNFRVSAQTSRPFWKPEQGYASRLRPDIVINAGKDNCVVLDTKWKNAGGNPSPEDLRQLYAYLHRFGATRAALVYPGDTASYLPGTFYDAAGALTDLHCGVMTLAVDKSIAAWQKTLQEQIRSWA